MTSPRTKAKQRFSEPFVQKFDKNLQMACVLHKFFSNKKEHSMQHVAVLAPSIIELFSRLDEDGIDISKTEKSLWGSGIKHLDEINDMLPEMKKKWQKVAKQKGLWKKLPPPKKIPATSQTGAIQDLNNIEYAECKSLREEALCVLTQTKEILKNSNKKKISIISDNYQLNKIIMSTSKLLDIKIINRLGSPFREIEQVDFIRLIVETVRQNFSPMYLLALLRHKLFALNKKDFNLAWLITKLENKYLRGIRRYETLEELIDLISENKLKIFLWLLQEEFKGFVTLMSEVSASFQSILKEVGTLAAHLAEPSKAFVYQEIANIDIDSENISPKTFLKIFDSLIANERLCLTTDEHATVNIFSLTDSDAVKCDYVIITGLNEETFFKNRSYDARIIQATYENLGLKQYDRELAKAEQAFAKLAQNKNVLLTRSTINNGAPQTPSRFLIKLELLAKKLCAKSFYNTKLPQSACSFYVPSKFNQIPLPAPIPPAEKRLKRLSVTQVEKLIRDPYSIYIRYILNLNKLEDVDKDLSQLEFGNFVHKVIYNFSRNYVIGKDRLDYFKEVMNYGQVYASSMIKFPIVKSIWLTQLRKLADWIINFEFTKHNNEASIKVYTETKGRISIPITKKSGFMLSCKADRVELADNKATIIDFKTGSVPSKKEVSSGTSPQLPLEALILLERGFDDIPISKKAKIDIYELNYITLGAGMRFGNVISFKENLTTLVDKTRVELKELITFYNKEKTPFLVCPDSERATIHNEFSHLERLEELRFYNKN